MGIHVGAVYNARRYPSTGAGNALQQTAGGVGAQVSLAETRRAPPQTLNGRTSNERAGGSGPGPAMRRVKRSCRISRRGVDASLQWGWATTQRLGLDEAGVGRRGVRRSAEPVTRAKRGWGGRQAQARTGEEGGGRMEGWQVGAGAQRAAPGGSGRGSGEDLARIWRRTTENGQSSRCEEGRHQAGSGSSLGAPQ
ncbi:hypothetical protein BO71DRAFT_434172 [Aspergillus ellipticus CBS 707.79]|uniref:Uncharacterized protein n=1 Tax=Aspergillus ellipticus CBS 707.79 TaxID=1448320 RepID=A0A319CY19_9EURO|nr:hypothetical protein BO71DRAFT_434172 [Aspergillus ellipticus CBS 707.79]